MPDPIIRSAFDSPADEHNGSGKRPVIFDVYAPDRVTSILPENLKMVLHVNPSSMQWTYTHHIERTQTEGGFVEAHWGSAPTEITMESVSGGFVRLYSGLSNITGPTPSSSRVLPQNMQSVGTGGTRRDSIAYDKFLDLLSLFYYNGAIYDVNGNIAYQGQICMTYDGGSYWGWFTTFQIEETVEKPYQFSLNIGFVVERELHRLRGVRIPQPQSPRDGTPAPQPPRTPVAPPPPIPGVDQEWRSLGLGTPLTPDEVAQGMAPLPQPPAPRGRGRR